MKNKIIKHSRVAEVINPFFEDSYLSSFGSRIKYGTMPIEEEQKAFTKSGRSDLGRVIDIRVPHGYHAQAQKSWEMYETDRLFRYLIERCIDFGVTGFEWEVSEPELRTRKNFWEKFRALFSHEELMPQEKEKKVWDTWAAKVNEDVPNVIPGIDEVNQWIFKHFLLGGMAPLEWQWEKIRIDGVEYELPMKMTVHNPLSIVLDRKNVKFTEEETYLILSAYQFKILESSNNVNQANLFSADVAGLPDRIKLNQMGKSTKNRQEAFVLKYKWSPGDNTALVYGRNVQVGQGLYPTPPFVGLFEDLIIRRQLHAADAAILDGIINFIIDWEIGDNSKIRDRQGAEHLVNQPRPERKLADGTVEESSIALAKKIITSDTRGPVMQIFHPYYFKFDIKMPDVTVLINSQKYEPTTFEIYQAFGILFSGKGKGLSDANTQNFEAMLENIRQRHVKRFWESLCTQVVKRNIGELTMIPNMIWKPLSTKTTQFVSQLLEIAKNGKVSTDTLLTNLGLDRKHETMQIAREVFGGEKELFDRNVAVSYVQAKVNPTNDQAAIGADEEMTPLTSRGRKQTILTPLEQPGRPKGKKKIHQEGDNGGI
jgi:hypothetical protein